MKQSEVVKQAHVDELKRLCQSRGYALNYHRKAGPYLTWGADCTEHGTPFEELFPSFQVLEYRGPMHPQVAFHALALGRLKVSDTELEPGKAAGLQEIVEQEEQRLQARVEYFRERQGKGDSVVPELAAERDALEKQIRRTEEVLREPYARLKAALKVWANETERQLIEGGASGRMEDFYKKARILWRLLTRGVKRDGLDSYLRRELSKFPAPEVVTRSTAAALLLIYTSSVHDVIVSALRMDRKRQVLERVLLYVLEDETIPGWEQVKDESNPSSVGRPPLSKDEKRTILKDTISALRKLKEASSFKDDICAHVSKVDQHRRDKETIHEHLVDTIAPELRARFPDLEIPEDGKLKSWKEATDNLSKAYQLWGKSSR